MTIVSSTFGHAVANLLAIAQYRTPSCVIACVQLGGRLLV